MDLTQLMILSGSIVTESNLSKSAKLQIFNWIQSEATEAQLKAFLLDGSISNLDEQAVEIVNDRFFISESDGRISKLKETYNKSEK
jgi:hypothetical protein